MGVLKRYKDRVASDVSCVSTWKDTVASVIISAVNVRFFRFQRPLTLAIIAGTITLVLTGCLAAIIHAQTCRTVRSTVPLPYVDQQLSGDAYCAPAVSGNQGWLLSDWVSYSDGNFSRDASVFFGSNHSEQWHLWPAAVNQSYDLSTLYALSPVSSQVTFGDVMLGCSDELNLENEFTGRPATAQPCFREPPAQLPLIGEVPLSLQAPPPNPTASGSNMYQQFTFTDTLSEQALAEKCPTISEFNNAFVKQAGSFIPQALRLFKSGPAGLQQLNSYIKSVDTRMYNFWSTLRTDRQLMILKILNEERQIYTYTEFRRTIPWPNPRKGGPVLQANQSCTWTMCVPKALAALNVCALYKGLNESSAAAFTYTDGKVAVIWGAYTDAITRMQVATPTCCQYAPSGKDYWCASPSADAMASAFAEVLVTASADFASPEHSEIQSIHPALYQRVRDLDARVRSVCAKDIPEHMSEAEQLMHELHTTVMGLAADMIARNQQFSTDYKRALSNIGLQCNDRLCLSTLGLIGTALGYAGWLEICASVVVLLVYFKLKPEEKVAFGDITAIATDSPEMPGDLEHYKSEEWKSGKSGRVMVSRRWAGSSAREVGGTGSIGSGAAAKVECGYDASSSSGSLEAEPGADGGAGAGCQSKVAGGCQGKVADDDTAVEGAAAVAAASDGGALEPGGEPEVSLVIKISD